MDQVKDESLLMKTVYVLVSRTDTFLARIIRFATAAKYNHTSICLSPDLDTFYSFARRRMYNPLIAGFIIEKPNAGILGRCGDMPCLLYALDVSDEAYASQTAVIDTCLEDYDLYRYNFLGVPLTMMGIPLERKHHYMCSQFVAFMLRLTGACTLPRPVSLMKPMHFTEILELRLVYEGALSGICDTTPASDPIPAE